MLLWLLLPDVRAFSQARCCAVLNRAHSFPLYLSVYWDTEKNLGQMLQKYGIDAKTCLDAREYL